MTQDLARIEIEKIEQALKNNGWVVASAARELGLLRTTLVEKMKKYGIAK
jgi:sigma-54 specific flagellar transcriptional regulator A